MSDIKPVRIARSRQKKQESPNGLPIVYVGRPTKWGNPYQVSCNATDEFRKKQIEKYRDSMSIMLKQDAIKELKGKNLSCWCKLSESCHADFLLKLANQ